jgi:hypothetical protein
MLKKQQKWIALVVACTFMWLLQVSATPLTAAGSTAQASAASAEQGPDYVEAISHKAAPAKKKSILPLVLIGVGAIAVTAAVLFLVVLKSYDITGNWTISWRWTVGSTASDTVAFTFTGTKKSGTVSVGYGDTGTYTVDGKNATWTLSSYDPQFVWTGKFDGKDKMSGTMVLPSEGESGTWTATRSGTTASLPGPAQAAKSPWNKD